MSNLFEALTRSQGDFPEFPLDSIWEIQADGQNMAQPTPAPPDRHAAPIQPLFPDEPIPPLAPASGDSVWVDARTLPLRVHHSAPILPFDGSHSRAGEQYRMIRTKIVQHPKKPKVVVVTSAGPEDGKTVTAINLAGALALKSGGRVVLLDGDFRRSRICSVLGLPPTPGLAEVLRGDCSLQDALVQAAQIPNLYVLPAGEPEVNPAELLDSAAWVSLCATCRASFAHMVIDSTPVGAVADCDLLQAACDGVILVARPDHTGRRACLNVFETVSRDKLIGVIVNGFKGRLLDENPAYYGEYYYANKRT